jgi:hypothetical protein
MAAKAQKKPIDNSAHFKHTEYKFRDSLYNAIVRRYGAKGNAWQKSDTFVWSGAIYTVGDWIPALAFLYFVYFITNFTYAHYGWFKAITVLAVMALIRVNAMVRKLDQMIRLMKGE